MPTFQNITREELIIRRILDDPVIQTRIISHLDPEYFEDASIEQLCYAILAGFKKYKRFPQPEELAVALPVNSAERNKLSKIMAYKLDKIGSDLVVDLVESFFKEKKTQLILIDAAESINERDFKNISGMISDLEKAVNFSMHIDIGLDLVEDTTEALRRLNETHKPIPSAISDIRAWTSGNKHGGGWYRAALSVFQGMPNVGKTIFLCNEAAYAYQNGYNVLYVSLELAEELIWERIASNVSNIGMSDIRGKTATEIEDLLLTNKEEGSSDCGEMVVRQLPSTTNTMDIENLMHEVKISKGYDIDIVIIDYLGKMKPNKSNARDVSLYVKGQEISEQLRDMGIKYEIPVLTASQVNRDGYGNTQTDMRNTAGSAAINDTADIIITITQDAYLEKYGLYLQVIIKNRFGPKNQIFLTECDYTHMKVRSAGNEKIKVYREAQLEQTMELTNYQNRHIDVVAKDKETVKHQKRAKESFRVDTIKQSKIKKDKEDTEKENILETEVSDNKSTKRRWDQMVNKNGI